MVEIQLSLVLVVWLTAVLRPQLAAANNLTLSFSRKSRDHPFRAHITRWTQGFNSSPRRLTYREMNMILRQEGGDEGLPVDCCPIVEEMVEPVGGRNRENMYVELYRDAQNRQRFFEYSCRPDVLDKPCRFIDRKFNNQSRCVQKFSYTYAIVLNSSVMNGSEEHMRHHHRSTIPGLGSNPINGSTWTLDYIRVRSGCSCEVLPKSKRRKLKKKANTREQDTDFDST